MEALRNSHQPSIGSSSGSELSIATSKRRRVVVSQSKQGCSTCKTRRVKCDEQKPLCQRCIQSGRLCGGYKDDSSALSALRPALKIGVASNSQTERLSYLAAHVLSLDNHGRPLHGDGVWGRIFLQLSNQVECVKAAAAAFGAAYELSLNNAVAASPCSAWHYYGSALARLQSDFNNQTADAESLALASVILACVEILGQHDQNALAHFLGAVQILTKTTQQRRAGLSSGILSAMKNELIKFDVLIGGYAMSQNPIHMHLESHEATVGGNPFNEPELAINTAMLCLHRSFRFIESASPLRFTYPCWQEHDAIMSKSQSDLVAQCHSVLDGLAALTTRLQVQCSSATSTPGDSEALAEVYAICTQLNAALIFIMCAHSPFETKYDKHQDRFQIIVSDAAASARLRRQTRASAFKRFSTRPGIIGPLFFVSIKCRDPSLRALAITLLAEQGREGPADGRIMAAIGTRLEALETSASVPSSPNSRLAACDVVEGQRVHGYSVPSPRIDSEGRLVIDSVLSRPNPPLLQGWAQVDYSNPDSWDFWSELIEI